MNLLFLLFTSDPLLPVSIACALLGLAMLVFGLRRLPVSPDEPVAIRIRNPLRRRGDRRLDLRRRKTD